jgi:hypothetical protein
MICTSCKTKAALTERAGEQFNGREGETAALYCVVFEIQTGLGLFRLTPS